MTVNMKCVIKSAKKDYLKIGKPIVAALIVAVVCTVGFFFSSQIVSGITYIGQYVTGSQTLAGGELIVLAILLKDLASTEKQKAKTEINSIKCIIENFMASFMVGTIIGISFMIWVMMTHPSSSVENVTIVSGQLYAFFIESCIIMFGILVLNILGTPLALAYARCKDEPDEPEPVPAEP
jgi:hypothetical protein